jgi:uncharacterized protein (TIGR00159 family)
MGDFFGLQISWRDLLDIAIVAYIYYRLILLIRGTRAMPVIYGLVLVILVYHASEVLGLYTLNWFLANFLGSIFIVVIILFQADIRRALARMGAGRFHTGGKSREEGLDVVVDAVDLMAKKRIGALIVLENMMPLGDIVERGVSLKARASRELLLTIFHPDTPLHDGAVVMRGMEIVAAGCILPLSPDLRSRYGTRHRAARGISEEVDCLALVVSEERGEVSLAYQGEITTHHDLAILRATIQRLWVKE